MSLHTSLIIKKDTKTTSIQSLLMWLETVENQSFSLVTIKNQPHISLINQEEESIKIATVREIKEKLGFGTHYSQKTQYFVFLDAHRITLPAQNALLKSIEEPPANTKIILITHDPEKLLGTIKSRCQLIKQSESKIDVPNQEKIARKYSEIATGSNGEKILLAVQYKDRQDALILCDDLISFLHSQLASQNKKITTNTITKNILVLLKTKQQLESNCNVLLALENCFFKLS